MNEPKHIKHTMKEKLRLVGLDVHAKNITIALAGVIQSGSKERPGVRGGNVAQSVPPVGMAGILPAGRFAVRKDTGRDARCPHRLEALCHIAIPSSRWTRFSSRPALADGGGAGAESPGGDGAHATRDDDALSHALDGEGAESAGLRGLGRCAVGEASHGTNGWRRDGKGDCWTWFGVCAP
jgi:hypothetical protein